MDNDDKTRPISLAEAAKIYGLIPDYLGQLANRGRFKAQKVGKMWVTTPHDLEDYIASSLSEKPTTPNLDKIDINF